MTELVLQSKSSFHDSTRVKNAPIPDEPALDNTPVLQLHRLKQRMNAMGKKVQSELNTLADSVVSPAVGEKVNNIITVESNIFSTVHKNVDFENVKPVHNEHKFEVR